MAETTTTTTAASTATPTRKPTAARKSTTTRSTARKSPSRTSRPASKKVANKTAAARGARTTAQRQSRSAAQANVNAARATAREGKSIAERAALVYVGATLEARDRVMGVAGSFVDSYGSRKSAERQLKKLEGRFERRGSFRGEEPPSGFDIKGNEDSMKYHTPESPYYSRTKAEVWFDSVEAAEAAGFESATGDAGADESEADEEEGDDK